MLSHSSESLDKLKFGKMARRNPLKDFCDILQGLKEDVSQFLSPRELNVINFKSDFTKTLPDTYSHYWYTIFMCVKSLWHLI